jgi:hypothetical protein
VVKRFIYLDLMQGSGAHRYFPCTWFKRRSAPTCLHTQLHTHSAMRSFVPTLSREQMPAEACAPLSTRACARFLTAPQMLQGPGVPAAAEAEFCSLLNAAIRADDERLLEVRRWSRTE